tara:strand:- start:821 stop:1291 length:471 start_codon:yes stop_codon:yes gene_type:complete
MGIESSSEVGPKFDSSPFYELGFTDVRIKVEYHNIKLKLCEISEDNPQWIYGYIFRLEGLFEFRRVSIILDIKLKVELDEKDELKVISKSDSYWFQYYVNDMEMYFLTIEELNKVEAYLLDNIPYEQVTCHQNVLEAIQSRISKDKRVLYPLQYNT